MCVYRSLQLRPSKPSSVTQRPRALSSSTLRERLWQGGLFHCTSVPALHCILRDGCLRSAIDTGAPACGAAIASRVRRLGGISLFDVPAVTQTVGREDDPARRWLWQWLSFHQPVTVAVCIDKQRLLASGGKLLCERDTRPFASGIMLSGEVCHLGSLPLACVDGYLFVRRIVGGDLTGCYLPGATPSGASIRNALAKLRRASVRASVPNCMTT